MEATINQEYVLHEKRVKELSRQAFARAHKNATVVDLEEQLPESAEIGTLYIVRKPVNYVGSDALFEFEESGWRFIHVAIYRRIVHIKGRLLAWATFLIIQV